PPTPPRGPGARPAASGRPATSTTPTAASTAPSTSTSTTCCRPSGSGGHRPSTPAPDAEPWPSPTPSSARSRPGPASTSPRTPTVEPGRPAHTAMTHRSVRRDLSAGGTDGGSKLIGLRDEGGGADGGG